jgi:hypothetical protein
MGRADPTLFTSKVNSDIFACQIYVNDIIFGSPNKSLCEEFSRIMTNRFKMSMMEELKFFLGFQIKQLKEGTFISPMHTNEHLDLNEDGKAIDQKVHRSMIGSLLYLCASRLDIMSLSGHH